jgi:putative nucleotidyltransferase with HDIG domain
VITILFVDDEANVLNGLRRMLHSMKKEWSMEFVNSGNDALIALCEKPYDVIISDMRMPGMDGVELLTKVMHTYPKMIRLVLSGHAEIEKILETAQVAHQYLAKPCDADTLLNSVKGACCLRELFANPQLGSILGRIDNLPSLPKFYSELMNEIAAPSSNSARVGDVIGRDLSMSMKVMQLVNSAFFGQVRHVSSPAQAVSILGLNTIKGLAITTQAFSVLDTSVNGVDMEELWDHSLKTASLATRIAKLESTDKKMSDYAFLAGLLHDIGKLVLASNLPLEYKRSVALQSSQQLCEIEAECKVFGCSHAEIGAYLANLWGFANPVVEAMAFHHTPGKSLSDCFTPLTAVYIAQVLLQHTKDAAQTDEQGILVDCPYLQRIGKEKQMPIWLAECRKFLSAVNANDEY